MLHANYLSFLPQFKTYTPYTCAKTKLSELIPGFITLDY
uniref:Uncharacterized protein n=1 Tax=Anguilla anguilla TaxID=7936 RepID=A0A0E9UP29_ANGAN